MARGIVPRNLTKHRTPSERSTRLRKLLEHYLSDANLQKDMYLYMMITTSFGGWIQVQMFLNFPLVQAKRAAVADIVMSLQSSSSLELKEDLLFDSLHWYVRRRGNPPLPAFTTNAWGLCRGLHCLQRVVVGSEEHTCNICFRRIQDDVALRCLQCDYDKCESCYQQERLKKELMTSKQQLHQNSKTDELARLWREETIPGKVVKIPASAHLFANVYNIMLQLSHDQQVVCGCVSRCWGFRQLQILSVDIIHNPHVWKKYAMAKDDMRKQHLHLGVKAKMLGNSLSGTAVLEGLTTQGPLDADLNEVFLFHGCKAKAAKCIAKEGFDIRHTKSNGGSLYGEGIYFAKQPCKSSQYSEKSGAMHMFIARVLLGDPNFLADSYSGRLPPFRDEADEEKGRFDSNVINPEESNRGQSHWESVIFKGEQAYPEMLITYKLPHQ